MKNIALSALVLLASFLPLAAQTVPPLVNYQGRLSNPDGSPLPTADYTLTFHLYDAATNGALVWGPQMFDGAVAQGHGARIPVVQGYFNVMLGPTDTTGRSLADAFTGTARYVEVTVSNRPPIAPRQQILTTPFAFQAANAARLAGYDWSALLGTNNPTVGTIPFSRLSQRPLGTNVGVGGVAASPPSGNPWLSPTPGQPTSVSNLAVTLATTGRPIFAFLTSSESSTNSHIFGGLTGEGALRISLFRNGVPVGRQFFQGTPTGGSDAVGLSPSSFSFLDAAPAGVHTYEVKAELTSGGTGLQFYEVRLVAFEL